GDNAFMNRDFNLVGIFGCVHRDRSAIVDDVQVRTCGKILLQAVVIAIAGAEEREVIIIDVDTVADAAPVHGLRLLGSQAKDDQNNQKKNSAGADGARTFAFALCPLVFHQLNHAPDDDQQGAVVGEPVPQHAPLKHSHVPQQKQNAEDDKYDGPGQRAARTAWRDWCWASHVSPHSLALPSAWKVVPSVNLG